MPKFYISTTTSDRPAFVRSRSHSFSHHHHGHHHWHHHRDRCFEDCAGVTIEQWNSLYNENKDYRTRNETLLRENQTLKADLQDNHRLHVINQQLANEVEDLKRSLSNDNSHTDKFRRRVADLKDEVDKKERHIHHLEKDNGILNARVREITRTMSDLQHEISELAPWRKKYNEMQARYESLKCRFDKTSRQLSDREADLQKRDDIIDDLRGIVRRHGLLHHHHPRPVYAYV
ncbi:hypothetical protein F5B20DRAFT_325627 [Whalleya microplaca]|nr:hypothetical protein F5B20DRAFT_325627 [Whalleya microplaca]